MAKYRFSHYNLAHIDMSRLIGKHLHEQLLKIPASSHKELLFHPAQLHLKDGSVISCAYVMLADRYQKWFGTTQAGPEFISIADVDRIEDCRFRLPAEFATQLHNAGESGMGYCLFTVRFSDGKKAVFNVGSTGLDFIDYPSGKHPGDVVGVEPHAGSLSEIFGFSRSGKEFKWALYDGIAG